MGKKKIIEKGENASDNVDVKAVASKKKTSRKKLDEGILHVRSTYNNTTLLLTDKKGNAVSAASAGSMGFRGAKKGTPFAAAKAAEVLAEKAEAMGLRKVDVVVKGVGAGRESSIRSFISKGIQLNKLKDTTPVPHGGVKPKKPRRV
jgi:small subunit ribosomal protein S11